MDKIVISEDKNKFLMDGKTVHFTKEDLAVIQEASRNTEDDISLNTTDNLAEESSKKNIDPQAQKFYDFAEQSDKIDPAFLKELSKDNGEYNYRFARQVSEHNVVPLSAQVKQEAVNEIVNEIAEEREGMLMLPEDVKTDKRVRGYSAAWLLGVLTGAVSVGMLVLSSFLLK